MTFAVVVSFQQRALSSALRRQVQELAERLECFGPNILRYAVWIEHPAWHKQQGALHAVRIDIAVPGRHIVVGHAHAANPAHEDPCVVVRDAFNAAVRQLENDERQWRWEIKHHNGLAQPAPKSLWSLAPPREPPSRATVSRVPIPFGDVSRRTRSTPLSASRGLWKASAAQRAVAP